MDGHENLLPARDGGVASRVTMASDPRPTRADHVRRWWEAIRVDWLLAQCTEAAAEAIATDRARPVVAAG